MCAWASLPEGKVSAVVDELCLLLLSHIGAPHLEDAGMYEATHRHRAEAERNLHTSVLHSQALLFEATPDQLASETCQL